MLEVYQSCSQIFPIFTRSGGRLLGANCGAPECQEGAWPVEVALRCLLCLKKICGAISVMRQRPADTEALSICGASPSTSKLRIYAGAVLRSVFSKNL